MKSNQIWKHGLAVLLASVSLTAHAGDKEGNGGGGFICKDPAQNELLDLFEAEIPGLVTENGLKIQRSEAPVEAQAQAVLSKVGTDSWLYHDLELNYRIVRQAKQMSVPAGYIAWPADAFNMLTKPDCKPTGLVSFNDDAHYTNDVYDSDGSKWVDQQNVNALPNTDQAALWVHETIYRFLRKARLEPNSVRARILVGHLFSDESHEALRRAFVRTIGLDLDEKEPRTIKEFIYDHDLPHEIPYPGNFGPRSCPAGQKLVEIGIWNDARYGIGNTSGWIFTTAADTKKKNILATMMVPAGLVSYQMPRTTACLTPGNYRYEFNIHGSDDVSAIEAPGGTIPKRAYFHFKNAHFLAGPQLLDVVIPGEVHSSDNWLRKIVFTVE